MRGAGKVSYCFYCGQSAAATGSCPTCLVPMPNPYTESSAPRTIFCPRCAVPLLAIGIAPGATVHACNTCHGVLLGARAWCTLLTRVELAEQLEKRLPTSGPPPGELVRLLRCPECQGGREMERGRFGASSNIVIDVCTTHGIWLDGGEISAVVRHSSFRSKVGAHEARRALDFAEARANPLVYEANVQAAAVMESARISAMQRPMSSGAKKGLGFVGVLAIALIARLVFYVVASRGAPNPSQQVQQAGENAGEASKQLGH